MPYRLLSLALVLVLAFNASAATQGGAIPAPLPLFPANNWWNVDISNAPVDPSSASFVDFINLPSMTANGLPRRLHPDFGGNDPDTPGNVYGIPYILVDGSQPKLTVDFVLYGNESDGEGQAFYPVPSEAISSSGWVEGGQPGNVDERDEGDRHIVIVDTTNNDLYELYNVWFNGTNWEAGSGAFFDMDTNNRRPVGWTSADAAGLAILPGLVRYDEVFGADEIRHALRVTVRASNGHVFPASHTAGSASGALPMGARLRLESSKDISSFTPEIQKIFRAFKKYGLIVADNGSDMYVSGAYDTRWNNDVLNPAFRALNASDFEVVQLGWHPTVSLVLTLPPNMGSGDAATATLTAYGSDFNVATGYTGTVHFTSTDGSATLPLDFTFTPGDNGTHTFPAGFILRTAGSHVVTVTDTASPTITGSDGVTVGPPAPTGLAATAVSTTQVNLTWGSSSGATQYEVSRASATSPYAPLTTTASTSFSDATATAGATFVYRVRALDASSRPSGFGSPDAATTILFTDDPVVAASTLIKAAHVTELRSAANAMQAAAGLAAAAFTDPALNGVAIKAVHLSELRASVEAGRAALGLSATTFTDPSLAVGNTVRAAHVQELRTAVK